MMTTDQPRKKATKKQSRTSHAVYFTSRNARKKTRRGSDMLDSASTGPSHEPFANSKHRPRVFVRTHVRCSHTSFAMFGKDYSSALVLRYSHTTFAIFRRLSSSTPVFPCLHTLFATGLKTSGEEKKGENR